MSSSASTMRPASSVEARNAFMLVATSAVETEPYMLVPAGAASADEEVGRLGVR